MWNEPSDRGFSLVEALVALAVFAMAGVALVQLQTQSLSTFSRIEARALADIAAQNRLVEIVASQAKPAIGAREEDLRFAGREWRMVVTVAATPEPGTRRASVAVGPRDAAPLSTAHAFFAAPDDAP